MLFFTVSEKTARLLAGKVPRFIVPFTISWFQVQVIEVVLNNTFYNVVDMKNLGLTNDKEVSKCSKHNLPGLFRNTQP